MSFWDNVKKFTQPYADDDYDEYEDEEGVDGYEEEVESTSRFGRRGASESIGDMPGFDFDSDSDNTAPSIS